MLSQSASSNKRHNDHASNRKGRPSTTALLPQTKHRKVKNLQASPRDHQTYWGVLDNPSHMASESSVDSIHELLGPNLRQREIRFRKGAPYYGSTGLKQLSRHPTTQTSDLETRSGPNSRQIPNLGCDPASQSLLPPSAIAQINLQVDPLQIPGQNLSNNWDAVRVEHGTLVVTPISQTNTTDIAGARDPACVVCRRCLDLGGIAHEAAKQAIYLVKPLTSLGIQINKDKSMKDSAQQFTYLGHNCDLRNNKIHPH